MAKFGGVLTLVALVALLGCAATVFLLLRHTAAKGKESPTVTHDLLHSGILGSESEHKDSATIVCTDPVWCNVPMPTTSYFRFAPPDDPYQWRLAQSQASSGEPVLLKCVREVFNHHMDFLDGEPRFRRYQELTDIFLDHNDYNFENLASPTTPTEKKFIVRPNSQLRRVYSWNEWRYDLPVTPPTYDFRAANRAAIVQVGYNAFSIANHSAFFEGGHLGEAHVSLQELSYQWKRVKGRIKHPFILLHAGNENWGLFSTEFPNRTIDWGQCCDGMPAVQEILSHPMTIAVLTNQHHNLTHPKLISLPRGLPLYIPNRKKLVYDLLRVYERSLRKETLVFATSSNWKHRPFISECIARKFKGADAIEASTYNTGSLTVEGRMTEVDYYRKLASARTVITLAGLGYDSFRLWETLTFGSVPVMEKGVGLDKALWRLPALLVEDFDEVTPELLRGAYVEALYRANARQFEFERLTQSFWWSFIMNVSTSMSQAAIDAKFPPESEDPSFARPRVPYSCGERMKRCGPGTKRPPRSSCPGQPRTPPPAH